MGLAEEVNVKELAKEVPLVANRLQALCEGLGPEALRAIAQEGFTITMKADPGGKLQGYDGHA